MYNGGGLLARNKYPEQTVQKILTVANQLFMKNGYDQTSLDDIATSCGVTKGAIYHHFKSKEELLVSMMESMENQMDWFFEIKNDVHFTGLEKLQKIFDHELKDVEKIRTDALFQHGLNDPKIISRQLQMSVETIAPFIEELLQEGIQDGSVHTKQPKQVAEMMMVLINIWINPGIFPTTKEEILQKVNLLNDILIKLGVPLFDSTITEVVENYLDELKQ